MLIRRSLFKTFVAGLGPNGVKSGNALRRIRRPRRSRATFVWHVFWFPRRSMTISPCLCGRTRCDPFRPVFRFGQLQSPIAGANPRRAVHLHGIDVAQIGPQSRPIKQKRPRRIAFNLAILIIKSGAGGGIRTLDPKLGKVPEGSTPGYPAAR